MPIKQSFGLWLGVMAVVLLLLPVGTRVAHAVPSVAEPFRDYYNKHQGLITLGYPLTGLLQVDGYPAQYFEKGRLEDHRRDTNNPRWAFQYGRLTAELLDPNQRFYINRTSIEYDKVRQAADPKKRVASPSGFSGGTKVVRDGIFVPFDAQLHTTSGYVIPSNFWVYVNQTNVFSGGWLHDFGLPLTPAFTTQTNCGPKACDVIIQAFERALLIYNPKNPPDQQIERASIGTDAVRFLPITPRPRGMEIPAAKARVTIPLHILARVGQPGEQATATLTWQDGTRLSQTFAIRKGEDGNGLLIDSLDWQPENPLRHPKTQPATLEIRNHNGVHLARQIITVLSPNDPNTIAITLYWTGGDPNFQPEKRVYSGDWKPYNGFPGLMPVTRVIPRTERIGTAALEELLWGPDPHLVKSVGLATSIPMPDEVLRPDMRRPYWGPRVTLRKLTIENGLATADFSQEIAAYGGGSARVGAIHYQIDLTLRQFPTVQKVTIAVEGETEGILQP